MVKVYINDMGYKKIVDNVNSKIESDYMKADIIVIGESYRSVPPSKYQEEESSVTYKIPEPVLDNYMSLINHAVKTNKPIIGIEGGMHLLNVISGGKMIQNTVRPAVVPIKFVTDLTTNIFYRVIITHNQWPSVKDMDIDKYKVLCNTMTNAAVYENSEEIPMDSLGKYFYKSNLKNCNYSEPVIVEYKDLNAIGFQYDISILPDKSVIKARTKGLIMSHVNKCKLKNR